MVKAIWTALLILAIYAVIASFALTIPIVGNFEQQVSSQINVTEYGSEIIIAKEQLISSVYLGILIAGLIGLTVYLTGRVQTRVDEQHIKLTINQQLVWIISRIIGTKNYEIKKELIRSLHYTTLNYPTKGKIESELLNFCNKIFADELSLSNESEIQNILSKIENKISACQKKLYQHLGKKIND